MLKQSLEKMRLLSASLGPLMCRTLDHLLCPAGTSVVRCSVRPGGGLQPETSGWEPEGKRGRATRAPAPSAREYGAAVLLRLTAAKAAIDSDPGPRSARAVKEQQPRPARLVRRQNKQVRSLQSPVTQRIRPARNSPNSKDPAPSRPQPGVGPLDGVAHFLSPVRSENASPSLAKSVPRLQCTRSSVASAQSPAQMGRSGAHSLPVACGARLTLFPTEL